MLDMLLGHQPFHVLLIEALENGDLTAGAASSNSFGPAVAGVFRRGAKSGQMRWPVQRPAITMPAQSSSDAPPAMRAAGGSSSAVSHPSMLRKVRK